MINNHITSLKDAILVLKGVRKIYLIIFTKVKTSFLFVGIIGGIKLDPAHITAKSVEISKCLINKETGFHEYDLDVTKSIGDLARFAVNIRQTGSITTEEQLAAVSKALKLPYQVVRSDILTQLEELGWADVSRDGRRIKRIDESVPPLEDILSGLGKKWKEDNPSDIDYATINSLSMLSKSPITKDALISKLEIEEKKFGVTLEYGTQANFLGTFQSKELGKETVWTPLYWAGKLDKVLKFLDNQPEDKYKVLGSLTKKFRDYPGEPIDQVERSKLNLVNAGVAHGFFPSVGVTGGADVKYDYIFAATPHFELDPKKDIFERARVIVACIRHGQYHAEVTKIKYPYLLLRALREDRLKPHGYAKIQYALLITNGICTYEPVKTFYGTGYKIKFIDTPENNVAMDIAEEMLRGREPTTASITEPEVKQLLTTGMFNYSSEQRIIKSAAKISAKEEFDRLLESIQGVRQ